MTTKPPNEALRDWAWHTGRAALVLAALAATLAAGSVLLLTAAYAIAGHGSWLPPLLLLATAVLVAGTVSWWRARNRPT